MGISAGSEQNISTAVMQRRNPNTNGLDFYPTPPWATRALMEHVLVPLTGRAALAGMTCWEPAAGQGDMARPLAEYFGHVHATDIHDHGKIPHQQHDFLMPFLPDGIERADWIISNPPFALAEQFIERAPHVPGWQGTAMLVRIAFLEGVGRWQRLYSLKPPTVVAQFTERVVMHHGRLSPEGSTATAYCWLVWVADLWARPMAWIPPCRKRLERADDYPDAIEGPSVASELFQSLIFSPSHAVSGNRRDADPADASEGAGPGTAAVDHQAADAPAQAGNESDGSTEGRAEHASRSEWGGGSAQVKTASAVSAPAKAGRVRDDGGASPPARERTQGSAPSVKQLQAGVEPGPSDLSPTDHAEHNTVIGKHGGTSGVIPDAPVSRPTLDHTDGASSSFELPDIPAFLDRRTKVA